MMIKFLIFLPCMSLSLPTPSPNDLHVHLNIADKPMESNIALSEAGMEVFFQTFNHTFVSLPDLPDTFLLGSI